MCSVDGDILETILLYKTMNENEHYWILGPYSFGVIDIFDSHVQSSIVVLTNKSCKSIVQLCILFNVKIEPNENIVFLLSDLDDDVCVVIFFYTPFSPFRKVGTPTLPNLLPIDVDNIPSSLP